MNVMNNYPASSVVPIMFTTYAGSTGASATLTGLAVTDIEIYKGTSMTQRSSDAGYALLDTDGIDIDGITGLHGFSIDLGDNTDAGFFAVGSFYTVVVSAVTVDSQTVTFIADRFRITPAESITGHPKTDVGGWLGTAPATPTVAGVPEVDLTHVAGSTTDVSTIPASVAAILVDTGTTLDGKLDTIDNFIDTEVGAIITTLGTPAGASVSADIAAVKAETASILVDTAEIGTAGAGLTNINLPNQTMDIVGNITGNLSGSVGSVTGAVGSVTGNVGGNVTGTVGSVVGAVGSVTGNVGGNVTGTIGGLTAAACKDLFDTDSTTTYASAVAGSVVKEIADNAGGTGLTAAAIADAVWDEDATGHQTGGTFGQAIGDPGADTNTIFGAVVTGAAGATVAADIIAIKSDTAATLVDTGTTLDAAIAAIQSDTNDIQTRIPSALTAAGYMKADMLAIDGETTSADRLAASTKAIAKVVVGVGSSATSIVTSSIDPAASVTDQFAGQLLQFSADTTTVALRNQKQAITGSSAAGVLTTGAFTTAPANTDTATIC